MSEFKEKKAYKPRKPWNIDNELQLINIWSTKTRQLRGPQKKWQIVKEIAEEMQSSGRSYSFQEVKMKMLNLTTKYKKEKEKAASSQWVLYQQMHSLLKSIESSRMNMRDNINYDFHDTSAVEITESDRSSSISVTSSQPLNMPESIASSYSNSSFSSFAVSRSASPAPREAANRINYQQQILDHLITIGTEFHNINSELEKTNIELNKRHKEITVVENRKAKMLQKYVRDMSELKDGILKFLNEQK